MPAERFDSSCANKWTAVTDDGCVCARTSDETEWPAGWTVRCLQPHSSANGTTSSIRLRMTEQDLFGTVGMCAPDAKPTFWLGAQEHSVGLQSAPDNSFHNGEIPAYKHGKIHPPSPTASFKEGQEVRLVLTPERTLVYYADGTEVLRQTLIPDGWVFAVGGCGLTKFEILDDDAQAASTAA